MKTYELSVTVKASKKAGLDLLRMIVQSQGYSPQDMLEVTQNGSQGVVVYEADLGKIKTLRSALRKLKLKDVDIRYKSLIKEKWQNRWKQVFKPFYITKSVMIVPGWLREKYKSRAKEVVFIDTTVAFGTGLHTTTQFVSQFIEQRRQDTQSMLDIGTGTGILALIAGKLGAEEIVAIDSDPESIRIAEINFQVNGVKPTKLMRRDIHQLAGGKRFDFVAANLFTDVLIDNAEKIVSFVAPEKYLAISGISEKNAARVNRVYKKLSLRSVDQLKGNGWVGFLFQKKADEKR